MQSSHSGFKDELLEILGLVDFVTICREQESKLTL